MRDERYSIQVGDDFVEIHGDLTIEETFDFLNFFEKKGFVSVTGGWENSTLVLSRKGVEQKWEEIRQKEHEESEKFYELLYKEAQEKIRVLNRRIEEVESLMRVMFSDESDKVKKLKQENDKLKNLRTLQELKDNSTVKVMLSELGLMTPEEEKVFERIVEES